MTWFKIDDQLAFHPKIIACTPTALALWVRAGAWCAGHLTDGHLSAAMLAPLGGRRRDAERLVEVGLWERTDGGYRFHNWGEYQPTKEQVERERATTKARVQAHRNGRRNAVTPPVTNAVGNGSGTPAPTRPVLKELTTAREARPTAPPDRFEEFWAAYPNKSAKVAARAAYAKAVKRDSHEAIMAGLRRYQFSTDPKYIPMPTTWLNQGRWQDEAPPPPADPWEITTEPNWEITT